MAWFKVNNNDKEKKMKSVILSGLAAICAIAISFTANAAESMQKNATISKVSDVKNMADDTTVYIQGYLVQNLGDEVYVFQDDSGKINVEIDDDLIGNAIAPDAIVWIAATVDNESGKPVSLEAEEIQLVPANATQPMAMNSASKK